MFCQKCGSQITEGATFCNVCGNQINAPHNHLKKFTNKKPLIITVAVFVALAIVGTIIGVSVSSCKNLSPLEKKLTAHTWIFKWEVDNQIYHTEELTFNKNGTMEYIYISFDGEGRVEEERTHKGNWNISEEKDLIFNLDGSEDYKKLIWEQNTTEDDCIELLNSTMFRKDITPKDWYVSNNFLKMGYFVYTPQ